MAEAHVLIRVCGLKTTKCIAPMLDHAYSSTAGLAPHAHRLRPRASTKSDSMVGHIHHRLSPCRRRGVGNLFNHLFESMEILTNECRVPRTRSLHNSNRKYTVDYIPK